MASFDQVKKEYDSQASTYGDYTATPLGKLETQLIGSALGDCTGATVLDLAGGTGLRARQVLAQGASSVDVVDLSPEMLRVGQETTDPKADVRWFVADVSQPLDHLPLRDYDLVMANWVFDHANSVAELEGMWRNVVSRLRSGGRFVGVRSGDPRSPAVADGAARYGVTYKGFEDAPDGVKFRYMIHLDPPLEFEASSMEVSYSGSTAMHEKFGLRHVQTEPYENAEVVQADREFWKAFLDQPSLVVVKARKMAD
ncbi:methyltransferase-like protein [Hypoxylon rubiginosum]|uniref:Methyltransferase-like protein n=1 Tax=Hypoxylon rubiginosum TaxID=110542 RepID=A0ACB9Z400_9PEZI|nr:methyltransferase-like protein [Hypoxylon rubiginosum]